MSADKNIAAPLVRALLGAGNDVTYIGTGPPHR